MSATVVKPNGLPRSIRLIKSADFGAVLSSSKEDSIRAFTDYFSVKAMKTNNIGDVRLGFTVGKHNAHLSVERVLVKRLLREASRRQRKTIQELISNQNYGLDLNFRLKQKLPVCGSNELTKQARKVLLKQDIDKLLETFIAKLAKRGVGR